MWVFLNYGFFKVYAHIAESVQEGSLFSTPSLAFIVCIFFDDGHSDWCEVVLYYSFDLHFSNNDIEHLVPLDNL